MSAASNYLENKLVEHVFRGVSFASPLKTYVALHTANPGETGINEVATAAYPAYARQDAARGGTQDAAWTAANDGVVRNALQLIWAMYDGSGPLTVTHFSVWDSAAGGNMLVYAPLSSSRTINPGDVFVADAQKLIAQVL